MAAVSPPAYVDRARYTSAATDSPTKRTLPSQNTKLHPPGWRLRKPLRSTRSGCAKGCASPAGADATLVAKAAGSYALHIGDGSDGFGRCLGRGMNIAQIATYLRGQPT